jgi:hypothetical protein
MRFLGLAAFRFTERWQDEPARVRQVINELWRVSLVPGL